MPTIANAKKTWFIVSILSAGGIVTSAPPIARADIFQWEYIDPQNPNLGKQQSALLAPDGAGVNAVPGANLSNRRLTMAYLIGADLTWTYDESEVKVFADLTGANLSQADLTNAKLPEATLTGADFTGAVVRGAHLPQTYDGTGINVAQLYSTASYQAHELTGVRLDGNDLAGVDLAGHNLTSADFLGYHSFDYYNTGANLTGANLSEANLANANFSGYYNDYYAVYGANLTNANLSGADGRGANFVLATVGRS